MQKVTASIFCIAILLSISGTMVAQPVNPRFGYLFYKGPNGLDIYAPELTDPTWKQVDYFVGGTKILTRTLADGQSGIVTFYRDFKVQTNNVNISLRAVSATNQIRFGTLINAPEGLTDSWNIFSTEFSGILCRPDTVRSDFPLTDTLYVAGAGDLPEVISFRGSPIPNLPGGLQGDFPGGVLHIANGGVVEYDLQQWSTVPAIEILESLNPGVDDPGRFEASGGEIRGFQFRMNVAGKVGPLEDLTLQGIDIIMDTPYETYMEDCTVGWILDARDFSLIQNTSHTITMKNCTVIDEGKVRGVLLAEDCLIRFDGNILATEVNNCTFELNGSANLGPANVPTSARYNTFTDASNIQINNESVVEYNQFCPDCLVSINPLAGGFDPDDVDDVHVNYNTFNKVGDDVGFISNSQADTIDGTLNYWGDCEGPGSGVSFSKVRTNPYLRVAWPETSYWLDITADKDEIIANDQDEVVFNLHFYNVVTAADSAGATVDYVIRIVGDTLAAGTLTMDANGRAELRVKVPFEYRNALALETYFTSIQCIDERFIINVAEQEGADLELFQTDVIQSVKSSQDLIAEKGFAVVTTISASEPVNTPFKVNVLVGANRYEEFTVIEKSNITVPFLFDEFDTVLTMPTTAPLQLVFFIQDETIQPGSLGVRVIVDPPEIGLPQGRILEGNETNNESSVPVTFTTVNWGNNGASDAQVHVQVLGEHSGQPLQKSALWADTAKTFIEKTWPMKSGQMSFNASPNLTDYTWLEEDSLVQETWQRYFMNVYRQTRMANPAFDRYVFAVPANYFETRFNKNHFNHKNSQTLAWSGIYDLAVASTGSFKHLVHTLGHTYHLRRGDYAPNDPEQQEQYYSVLPGIRIQNGFDHIERRMYQDGLQNLGGRFMASHCFMGGSQLDVFGNPYFLWISGVEYDNLGDQLLGNQSGTPTVPKAMLVAGSVDSTNFDFEFVPWSRLDNATPSAMVNDTYADYIFKAVDGSDNVLATYNYTPTFVALGLDETNPAENPHMEREYFAFVMPAPDGTAKIVVETATGTAVTERVISANAPVIDIVPADNSAVLPDDVTLSWSATDADGDTEFWYTVYYREPGGDWQLIQFEDQNMSHSLGTLAEQNGYQVRVVASDGVNTSEKTHTFHVSTNDAEDLSSPNSFALHQNYPNPFNPSTAISFTIPRTGFVALDVYDQLGRKVRTLVNERVAAGTHTVNFSADGLTSGQYTAVMRFADGMKTISMTLAK